ncbi:MAG: RNA pseudouridine synthase [Treponema sp.]|jgi:23S rRNA pseudouridine1911/1915/1917 synthase|nr:RNA pseudouridine synthase [Treponema sp.]
MTLKDRIVMLSGDYLVLNKLPGESAETAPREGIIDLPRALQKELGDGLLPGAPHRLDVPVSGCTLFTRNPRALSFLSGCFRIPGQVEKIYWAITDPPREAGGCESPALPTLLAPPEDPVPLEDPAPRDGLGSGWVELVHWLAAGRGNRSLVHNGPGPGRKKSVLRCRVLGWGDRYIFLEIMLITGRRHQIRAQLSHIGLPVKGDLKYGARRSERNGGIRLHCRSLAFPDPAGSGRIIQVEALPPERDNLWRAFLEAAGSSQTGGNLPVIPCQGGRI